MDPVVILGTDVVSVGPGQEQRIPVRVRNQGRRVESYRVDVVGVPAQFAEVNPPQVSVLPGREAELDVVFRPPGGANTPTGSLPFAVRATSQVDASSSAVAEARLELAGVAGLQAWAQETSRAGRWSATYHLEFVNAGNAALRLAVWARDPGAATRVKVVPDVVDMPAGGRASAVVEVKARHPFLRGSVQNRTLQADCQTFAFGTERPMPSGVPPVDDPHHRTFQLSFQQKPILPRFLLPLLAVVVAAALVFAVLTLRKTTGVSLDVTNPLVPIALPTTPGGADAMLIAWQPVPNAEGYSVRQVSVNDSPNEEVVAPKLPPEQTTLEVDSLTASTKYCYQVRALGPEGKDSPFSETICGTTGPPTSLLAPHSVDVVPAGGENYKVSWLYDGQVDGVEFTVLVAGAPVTTTPAFTVEIPLKSEAEERTVDVVVQALKGEETSPLSAPKSFTIPALPPPTTVAGGDTTVAVATTLPGGGGGPGETTSTVASPAQTTTSVAATTTTTPAPVATTELQDLAPITVAMLGSVPPGSSGGVTVDQRMDDLATRFGQQRADLRVFTNRDTIAKKPDGTPAIANTSPPSERFIYVVTPDAQTAETICGDDPDCAALQLTGAARASAGAKSLLVEVLPAAATVATVDEKLVALRTKAVGLGAYAVDGSDYPDLLPPRAALFVTGFADDAARDAFCTTNAPPTCTAFTFGPPG